mmetsp:Transcript_35279/g.82496  ORF Transcript_35279/g.82496 Transcript_35279/m.82496 type:complete len:254 (-) Transcript_35279:1004-1765(-)
MRFIQVPRVYALAVAHGWLVSGARRRLLCLLDEARRVRQPARALEQLQQLGERGEVSRLLLEQLLEVIDGGVPLALLHHQVGEDHRSFLVVWRDAHQRDAHRLRLLVLAAVQVQPRLSDGRRLRRFIKAQRLRVCSERLLVLALLLVVAAELDADRGRHLALLRREVGRVDAHARKKRGLSGLGTRQCREGRLVLLLRALHSGEQPQRIHVVGHFADVSLGDGIRDDERTELLGRLLVLLQVEVKLGQLVPQN